MPQIQCALCQRWSSAQCFASTRRGVALPVAGLLQPWPNVRPVAVLRGPRRGELELRCCVTCYNISSGIDRVNPSQAHCYRIQFAVQSHLGRLREDGRLLLDFTETVSSENVAESSVQERDESSSRDNQSVDANHSVNQLNIARSVLTESTQSNSQLTHIDCSNDQSTDRSIDHPIDRSINQSTARSLQSKFEDCSRSSAVFELIDADEKSQNSVIQFDQSISQPDRQSVDSVIQFDQSISQSSIDRTPIRPLKRKAGDESSSPVSEPRARSMQLACERWLRVRQKRTSYTFSEQVDIVNDVLGALKSGIMLEDCLLYEQLPRSTWYKMQARVAERQMTPIKSRLSARRSRRLGGGRRPILAAYEHAIKDWIMERRTGDPALPVSLFDVISHVNHQYREQLGAVRLGYGWMEGFMRRNRVSYRSRTTFKNHDSIETRDIIAAFRILHSSMFQYVDHRLVWNMDETAVQFSMPATRTLAPTASKF
jgi:hypothetical protein